MSKRGRRRSSRRRKSSSSSKQSASSYIFPKQNHRNSESCRDETVEKGETDSLRKENAPSGSDEKERLSNEPIEEKRFKPDHDVTSFQCHKSVYTKTTELEEKGLMIVTSVSVSDMINVPPKVVFRQSHEHFPEHQINSSGPVTDILKVNCTDVNVKLEIPENVRLNTCCIQTTFNFTNGGRDAPDMTVEHQCERTWTSDAEMPPGHEIAHTRNPDRNDRFTFDSRCEQMEGRIDSKSVCLTSTWATSGSCQCHCDHDRWMMSRLPDSPLLLNLDSPWKWKGSADQFWDIPPPEEFADGRYDTLEDLTHDLASFRIGACSPAYKRQRSFHLPDSALSRRPFSAQTEEGDNLPPSFDQLSESDNYEPMFMRPSFSTTRSSFTKDFVHCQKRKSWIKHNSIATVEHSICSILSRRRQTYPGLSGSPGKMQDEYSESFSSLITCLLPLQAERLERMQQFDDGFSAFEMGHFLSSQTRKRSKRFSDIPDICEGQPALLSPFCRSYSHGRLTVNEEDQTQRCSRPLGIGMEIESLDTDTYEPPDSGFDQEIREVESHSPEGLAEEGSIRGLAIQVIPPSCSGSEEHMLHPSTALQSGEVGGSGQTDLLSPKSSVTTGTGDALQVDSSPSPGVCKEQDLQTALEDLCKSALQDGDKDSPKTDVVTEETVNTFAPQSTNVELQAGTDDPDKPAGAASCSDKQPPDVGVNAKAALIKANKAVTLYRSSSESKEHLKPVAHKDREGSVSDQWAKRRKLFKDSKQWSSAGGSSFTSDITEESVSEDTHSADVAFQDSEDFYTETFHFSAWIYQGDEVCSEPIRPSLTPRARPVSIRERTIRINKGIGEYPWGFRIQFSKPIVVTEVDTNGAAEEAGLMVGDCVIAVNGIDVTSIPHSEAANLARQGPDVLTLTIGSDIARCPNTPRPPCRGYLHKRTQSGLIKGWRKRWFVLTHDCCLHYYKHKRDEGRRRALSSVKLEGADVGLDDSLGKPFVFRCHPLSGQRIYLLCATSNQDMKRWLEAMEKAIHPITQNHVWVDVTRHNSNLPPLAVKNPDCLGLLNKMDKIRDTWVQHYCILKDGCLYLYSGIRATHAHGGIYLQGYMVREQPYGSKKSTIELRPPSDEFKTFYLCSDNSAENKRWIMSLKASIKKWLPLHQALQDYVNRLPEETRM